MSRKGSLARKAYWRKISEEEKSQRMRETAAKKYQKMSKRERLKIGEFLAKARKNIRELEKDL